MADFFFIMVALEVEPTIMDWLVGIKLDEGGCGCKYTLSMGSSGPN